MPTNEREINNYLFDQLSILERIVGRFEVIAISLSVAALSRNLIIS